MVKNRLCSQSLALPVSGQCLSLSVCNMAVTLAYTAFERKTLNGSYQWLSPHEGIKEMSVCATHRQGQICLPERTGMEPGGHKLFFSLAPHICLLIFVL